MTTRAPDYRDRGPGFRRQSDVPKAEREAAEQRRQERFALLRPSGSITAVKPESTKVGNDLPDLDACEQVMVRGFQDVARAIARIREARLYTEAGYETFDAYCEDRMGITRKRGDQLASAHFTIQSLPKRLATIVGNEAKARAITAIPETQRVAVLDHAIASGEPLTAKSIRAATSARQPPPKVIDVTIPADVKIESGAWDNTPPIQNPDMTHSMDSYAEPEQKRKPCPTYGGCGTIEGES